MQCSDIIWNGPKKTTKARDIVDGRHDGTAVQKGKEWDFRE